MVIWGEGEGPIILHQCQPLHVAKLTRALDPMPDGTWRNELTKRLLPCIDGTFLHFFFKHESEVEID